MNIYILDSWLREFLETKASAKQIAKQVSLSGPTFDRTDRVKVGGKADWLYDIEVTANRVDAMSVSGIAREVAAILPRFGIAAKLKTPSVRPVASRRDLDIKIKNNPKLGKRVLAIKMENVKVGPSPKWMRERLINAGQRPLNSLIDITNYAMWEMGHPIHVFDYDKLKNKTIVVREAEKGEGLVTLDGKNIELLGGEVVFDNGEGEIIDLPGIMGTKNTVVGKNTKNILVWIESIDPTKIRQASMAHSLRSQAAILNEKGVDPNLGLPTILRAIELYKEIAGGKVASKLIDINEEPYKQKRVRVGHDFIQKMLSVSITKQEIKKLLTPLGFACTWKGKTLTALVPSFRNRDIGTPEDIVEEVARIYGYHKLPSVIMDGEIPDTGYDSPFELEGRIKSILAASGGNEVYTYSLVPKDWVGKNALKVKNPLGMDTEYLRTSMMQSLVEAARKNKGEKESFHLFEISKVYIPRKGKLPKEKMMLAGIMQNQEYRRAKGVIEKLLNILGIIPNFEVNEGKNFKPGQRVLVTKNGSRVGQFGVLKNSSFYYEFDMEAVKTLAKLTKSYRPIPKFPPQIEDITFTFPEKTLMGDVIEEIGKQKNVENVELVSTFKDNFTFRVWYQDKKKTLTDKEVETLRKGVIEKIQKKHGGKVKD